MVAGLSALFAGDNVSNQSNSELTTSLLGDSNIATASEAITTSLASITNNSLASANQTIGGNDIVGDSVVNSITPAAGIGTAPVGMASKQVIAAKSQPQVVAINGGSNQSIQNNVTQQQTVNMGALNARSQDLGVQTLREQSMA